MKRHLLTLAVAFLLGGTSSFAQSVFCHFGAQAGMSFSQFSETNLKPGWHIGATVNLKLPAFFSIQPSVWFNQVWSDAKTNAGGVVQVRQDQLTIPLAIEWGPDLGVLRPFIEVVPFVDINLNAQQQLDSWQDMPGLLQTAQFGTGLGAGLDIWKIQISARYNWIFGNWLTDEGAKTYQNLPRSGVTVSLTYFFF